MPVDFTVAISQGPHGAQHVEISRPHEVPFYRTCLIPGQGHRNVILPKPNLTADSFETRVAGSTVQGLPLNFATCQTAQGTVLHLLPSVGQAPESLPSPPIEFVSPEDYEKAFAPTIPSDKVSQTFEASQLPETLKQAKALQLSFSPQDLRHAAQSVLNTYYWTAPQFFPIDWKTILGDLQYIQSLTQQGYSLGEAESLNYQDHLESPP